MGVVLNVERIVPYSNLSTWSVYCVGALDPGRHVFFLVVVVVVVVIVVVVVVVVVVIVVVVIY